MCVVTDNEWNFQGIRRFVQFDFTKLWRFAVQPAK
jgi:hypothetical protein